VAAPGSCEERLICLRSTAALVLRNELRQARPSGYTRGATGVNKSALSLKAIDEPSIYIAFFIVLLSCVLYVPFLALPFLPDDYLQITMARKFGSVSQWRYLLDDTLFRNRATSLVVTYWTDRLFPLSPLACGVTSILLHAANGLLVYSLGVARSIGWRLSALTAIAFALQERHHEAVVWYAALPELLVFLFGLATIVLWLQWLNARGASIALWTGMAGMFILAALSKESAVAIVLLMLLLALMEKAALRRTVQGILPVAVIAAAYVLWIFHGGDQNHHFYDGTFALHAGFLKTVFLSAGRGLWIWGWVALGLLLLLRVRNSSTEYRACGSSRRLTAFSRR
jgi:hypothetical protein